MKQGDLLRVELCGPESNPKESGEYSTFEEGHHHAAYYSLRVNKWYEYEPSDQMILSNAFPPEEVFPDFWYKPVGKTEEQIIDEATQIANECCQEMLLNRKDYMNSNAIAEMVNNKVQLNKDKDK